MIHEIHLSIDTIYYTKSILAYYCIMTLWRRHMNNSVMITLTLLITIGKIIESTCDIIVKVCMESVLTFDKNEHVQCHA